MNSNSENFTTTDLPLATWLFMNGRQLLSINPNGRISSFTFATNSDDEILLAWMKNQQMGNVLSFFNCYQELIRRSRELRNQEQINV